MSETNRQFDEVIAICREMFEKKSSDYGPTWRILRPESVTDQLLIKANRIRSLEIKKESKVGEDFSGFIGIVGIYHGIDTNRTRVCRHCRNLSRKCTFRQAYCGDQELMYARIALR